MTAADIKTQVKAALCITGTGMDASIQIYIDEVLDFIRAAGFKGEITSATVGVVACGVKDLFNNESGSNRFSDYFCMRVTQLCASGG